MPTEETDDECNVWPCTTSQIHEFADEMLIRPDLGVLLIVVSYHLNCGASFHGNDVRVAVCQAFFNDEVANERRLINV